MSVRLLQQFFWNCLKIRRHGVCVQDFSLCITYPPREGGRCRRAALASSQQIGRASKNYVSLLVTQTKWDVIVGFER